MRAQGAVVVARSIVRTVPAMSTMSTMSTVHEEMDAGTNREP
jgi:hypothetical protein